MDPYSGYSYTHPHSSGPSSSSSYYRIPTAHASSSMERLQMGAPIMSDDVVGSGAASVYPLTNDFSLGSSTSYGRYDHQATIQNATVTGLRVQAPSRAMMSSMVPMASLSRNSFASSEWTSGLVFNYGFDAAPHFDAPVASTSSSANSFVDKSWPGSHFVEPSTNSSHLTHIEPTTLSSTMAILPQYQHSTTPIIRPEVTANTVPENEGPKLPDIYATIPLPPTNEQSGSGRKKDGRKHACHMCHKSFDRPCTLRKHMLVHTGQKAYQCENCQRRFSVQSNLNRHGKRCGQARSHSPPHQDSPRPISEEDDGEAESSPDPPPSATSAPRISAEEAANTPSFSISGHLPVEVPRRGGRASLKRPRISPTSTSDDFTSAATNTNTSSTGQGQKRRLETDDDHNPASNPSTPPITQVEVTRTESPRPTFVPRRPRKRARRAPSPSRWIPDSLKLFDLTRIDKSTPKPLPPVQPYQDPQSGVHEERDSFDDNAPTRPYHPGDWKGKLPGPGLMKDETMKMGGTLLVF